MRVAALYDIHGNLPALEAVLAELDADTILVGGDAVLGPMPKETLELLRERGATFLRGNTDRAVGGGVPDDDPWVERVRWAREQLDEEELAFLRGSPASALARRRGARPHPLLPRLTAERRGDLHGDHAPEAPRPDARRRAGARGRLRAHARPVRPARRRPPARERGQRGHALRGRARHRCLGAPRPGRRSPSHPLRRHRGGGAHPSLRLPGRRRVRRRIPPPPDRARGGDGSLRGSRRAPDP